MKTTALTTVLHYNQCNDLLDSLLNPEVFHYRDGDVQIPEGPVSASR